MKSAIPKVLHKVCQRPMLSYVLDLVRSLNPVKAVVVLGHGHDLVKKEIPYELKVEVQERLLGTADAVKTGLKGLKGFKGTVLILYGDTPLLFKKTAQRLIKFHCDNDADVTLLTAHLDKPVGYGRVLRDEFFSVSSIVEENSAGDFEKEIKEVNTGIMCFKKESLEFALRKITPNNRKKEYYLTDAIKILYSNNKLVEALKIKEKDEVLGINSRAELSKANSIMQLRINESLMSSGVSIIDPKTTFIGYGTKIGRDTVIYPFTVIESNVKIGKNCSIGPFARLREGANISDDVTLGNFLEVTRAKIGKNTFAKHFCYIADTRIGKFVNIGAGSVTANFDGVNKHKTLINDHVLIGSDTIMVAPVNIGRGAKTGAGAVVVKDVPGKSTVVGVPARILRKRG